MKLKSNFKSFWCLILFQEFPVFLVKSLWMATGEEDIQEAVGSYLNIIEVSSLSFLDLLTQTYIPVAKEATVVGSHKHIAGVWIFYQFEADYLLGTDRLDVAKHIECLLEHIAMHLSIRKHRIERWEYLLKLK